MGTAHEIAIAAQEQRLAELDATIAARAATLAAMDAQAQQKLDAWQGRLAAAQLQADADVARANAAAEEATSHYKDTYARVRQEYEAKVADFNASIAALREERQREVLQRDEVREQLHKAHGELAALQEGIAQARADLKALRAAAERARAQTGTQA